MPDNNQNPRVHSGSIKPSYCSIHAMHRIFGLEENGPNSDCVGLPLQIA
jgi:hypothetical protein